MIRLLYVSMLSLTEGYPEFLDIDQLVYRNSREQLLFCFIFLCILLEPNCCLRWLFYIFFQFCRTSITSLSLNYVIFVCYILLFILLTGTIPLRIFSEWWLAKEKFSLIDAFIHSSFPGATFHGCNGLSVKYQVTSSLQTSYNKFEHHCFCLF